MSTSFHPFAVQVDGQSPKSWSDILAHFDDSNIYQSWAYGAVRWGQRNLSHLVIRESGRVIAAAQLRLARVPLLRAGIAYLRWGPLCQRKKTPLDPIIAHEMFSRLQDEYVKRRGLTLQIIPNAYDGDTRGAIYTQAMTQTGLRPEPELKSYRTVVVDLSTPPEAVRKQLDKKWRNQLSGAERNELTLDVSDGNAAYREFVSLYKAMWQRKQFTTSVDVEEFGRIQEQLVGQARMQTFLARKEGRAVAALVCSFMGDTAIYLLGATNDQARELKAAYFLHWRAILWLKERGAHWYDLGGIDPEANPGGYHFKSGFRGAERTQLMMTCIQGNWISHQATTLVRFFQSRINRGTVRPTPNT